MASSYSAFGNSSLFLKRFCKSATSRSGSSIVKFSCSKFCRSSSLPSAIGVLPACFDLCNFICVPTIAFIRGCMSMRAKFIGFILLYPSNLPFASSASIQSLPTNFASVSCGFRSSRVRQHFLYFFPLPHRHGSFLPNFMWIKSMVFIKVSYYNIGMASNQIFKAVYFSDYKEMNPKAKGVVLAFGERNIDLYKSIADLGSNELRNLLGTDSYLELEQRARAEGLPVNTYCLWYLRKSFDVEEPKVKVAQNSKAITHFENKVIEGDCLEVMNNIPQGSIDMVLCDLPYGTTQNHWDSVIPLDQLWKQYERIIKDNGVIV